MAHDKKSSIRAVYNQAQHLEERRKIMQVWADFLDLLRDKGEVVDFQTARQQSETSMNNKKSNRLQDADKQELIDALISKDVNMAELKEIMEI